MFSAIFGLGLFVAIVGRVCWEVHTDLCEQERMEEEWMQHNRIVASERARHARELRHIEIHKDGHTHIVVR